MSLREWFKGFHDGGLKDQTDHKTEEVILTAFIKQHFKNI